MACSVNSEEKGLQFEEIFTSKYQVEKCSFSSDGRLLVVCLGDYSVRVFSINSNHAPSSLLVNFDWNFKPHSANVWCANFSLDSSLLCTCSSDATVGVWDLRKKSKCFDFTAHSDTVWCCSFAELHANGEVDGASVRSPSGNEIIATGSSDKTVKIWRLHSGEVLHSLGGYSDAVDCVDFVEDGSMLCTGSRDGTIRIWANIFPSNEEDADPVSPVCLLLQNVNHTSVQFCMFSTSSTCAASLHLTVSASTLSMGSSSSIRRCRSSERIAETPNNILLASGVDNSIFVWNVQDIKKALKEEEKHNQLTLKLDEAYEQSEQDTQSTTDDESSSSSSTTEITETELSLLLPPPIHSIPPRLSLTGHVNTVWGCCFAKIVISDDQLHEDVSTGNNAKNSASNEPSSNEQYDNILISCSGDRSLRLWDLEEGVCLMVVAMPNAHKESQILTCSFSPETSLLAVGLYSGTLFLIDMLSFS